MTEALERLLLVENDHGGVELRIYTVDLNSKEHFAASATFDKIMKADDFAERLDMLARNLHNAIRNRDVQRAAKERGDGIERPGTRPGEYASIWKG